MKITIENIEAIGFEKHDLFRYSFIYRKKLGESYEVRIQFYTKEVKSNDDYFDLKKKDDSDNWVNYKYKFTGKYDIVLFSGDDFDKSYKLPLNTNTIGQLKSFINAFYC